MEINITPENSVIFRVYDIEEVENDKAFPNMTLTLRLLGEDKGTGKRMRLKMMLDSIGCQGFQVALSALVDTGDYLLPPDYKMEYGCYYIKAIIEGVHDLMEISFLKLPARTVNSKDGKYDELDDCAVFMRRSKEYDYQYLHIIIPTINSTINAFVDYEYVVFEFGIADEPETQFSWGKHCYTTPEKFRAALNLEFPLQVNAEFNRNCYGYCKSSERGDENA